MTTMSFDPTDFHPSNMPRTSQWVSNDHGHLICGECMHTILFDRFGHWDLRWSMPVIERMAARVNWERMPDGTDDWCSDCDRDLQVA